MKTVSTTSQLLFFILTGAWLLSACMAKPDHEVGASIQGTYTVYFGQDSTPIGFLTLSSGHYSFESNTYSMQSVVPAKSRFFFMSHLKGAYHTEYIGSTNANSVLENLDDGEILVTISFDEAPAQVLSYVLPNNIISRTFLIRNNQQDASLYFHSMVSELELWRIEKSWESKSE